MKLKNQFVKKNAAAGVVWRCLGRCFHRLGNESRGLPRIFLVLVFLLCAHVDVSAAVIAVDFGGTNLVTANRELNGSLVSISTGTFMYGDGSLAVPLSPSSGYTGQAFYGAFQTTTRNYGATTPAAPVMEHYIRQMMAGDRLRLTSAGDPIPGSSQDYYTLVLFKKEDFLNGADIAPALTLQSIQLQAGASGSDAAAQSGRYLVQDGSTLYISNAIWNRSVSQGLSTAFDPTTTTWSIYTPSATSLAPGSLSFQSVSFTNVTAVGIYSERLGAPFNGAYAGLDLVKFSAVMTIVVPEPGTLSLALFGLAAWFGVSRRRKA